MARRERKEAENGPDGQPAKSAGFRENPREHAGTVAIGREKAPTENSWGFNSGGAAGIEQMRFITLMGNGNGIGSAGAIFASYPQKYPHGRTLGFSADQGGEVHAGPRRPRSCGSKQAGAMLRRDACAPGTANGSGGLGVAIADGGRRRLPPRLG